MSKFQQGLRVRIIEILRSVILNYLESLAKVTEYY